MAAAAEPGSLDGAARGYLPAARPRWRWVECPFTGDDDLEGEPFRCEIRSNLTWGEIDAIDLAGELTFADLWARMAPHVRAWNALGIDAATGEAAGVAAPAEGGPEAFRSLEPALTLWIATQLRTAHLGGDDRAKKSGGRGSSPEPGSGAGSA